VDRAGVGRIADRASHLYQPKLSQRSGESDIDRDRPRHRAGHLPEHADRTFQLHQSVDRRILKSPAVVRSTWPSSPSGCAVPGTTGQFPQTGRTRPGRTAAASSRWIVDGRAHFWIVMTSLSVSLPQTEKFCVQPKRSASATAVPCLKVFAPLARTRTVIC
jgi:hypothetical protein